MQTFWPKLPRPLFLVWLLALPALWFSLLAAPTMRIDVGEWGDHAVLTGVSDPEESASESYRWTGPESDLSLPAIAPAYRLLVLRAHGQRPSGAPPSLGLTVAGSQWGQWQMHMPLRVYQVLLPESAIAPIKQIHLHSETYQPPNDPRQLGVAIDWLELRQIGQASFPSPWYIGGQALLLALALILMALFIPAGRLQIIIGLLLVLALLGLNLAEVLWVALALHLWLLVFAALIVAVLLFGPVLAAYFQPWLSRHQTQIALALITIGLLIRLLGAIHPFFDAHDLPVHDRWMRIVAAGQLYLYSTPGELQNRLTFNPPAGYLLMLPLWLAIGDLRLVIQVGTALLDGLGCLLLLPVARELGIRGQVALFGLGLYLVLPINTTILWWGFATNDIAQTLWLLLLWRILCLARRPSWREAGLVGFATALCALTHVGALVLLVPILGLLAIAAIWRLPRNTYWVLWASMLLSGLILLIFYFSAAAIPVLTQPPALHSRTLTETLTRSLGMLDLRLGLVSRAYTIGFTPLLLGLLPLGLLQLWYIPNQHRLLRPLVGSWLAISAFFFGIYLSLGFLTRYIYFDAPLWCLAGGMSLSYYWQRPKGRIVVFAIILLVAWVGASIWFSGVLLRDKPSLVPLTH